MAKSIVFVLHGMGEYDANWLQADSSVVKQLYKDSKKYDFFKEKSLSSYAEFVPILYDDVFLRILKYWNDLGEALEKAVPVMPNVMTQVVDYLMKSDDDKWVTQYAGDVLLYWGFRLFQQRVVLRVLAQISQKIADTMGATDEAVTYHILAHSLGTSVAHDALHHLGTEDWLGSLEHAPFNDMDGKVAKSEYNTYRKNNKRLKNFQFNTVTMLSNVCGLIHPAESPYRSIVRPGTGTSAITRKYINVNHKYDPIAIAGSFSMPESWLFINAGVDQSVDHVLEKNIHSAWHYVAHPAVHLQLLSHYVEDFLPSQDDVNAIEAFESKYGVEQIGGDVKSEIESLIDLRGEGIGKLLNGIEKLGF